MKTTISPLWSDMLRKVLKDRGLSYTKAAMSLGISVTYMQQMVEYGKVPSESIVERILKAFPELDKNKVHAIIYGANLPDDWELAMSIVLEKVPVSEQTRSEFLEDIRQKVKQETGHARM